MCEHFYVFFERFWICLECKIIGLEINGRQFQVEFPLKVVEYPKYRGK